MAQKITEIVGQIVDLLVPLAPEDRRRVVTASLTLLGDANITGTDKLLEDDGADGGTQDLPVSARRWMKQNGISIDEIQQVFHLADGRADLIASEIPGNSDKEKIYNADILVGIGQLLASGDAVFADVAARSACESLGCYNSANHAAYMKARGNEFAGSKEKGWTLTAPGLKRGASLVKAIAK